MNSKCYCTGWSLVAGLLASVLALPSVAAPLTLDEALRLAEKNAPHSPPKRPNSKLPAAQPSLPASYPIRNYCWDAEFDWRPGSLEH